MAMGRNFDEVMIVNPYDPSSPEGERTMNFFRRRRHYPPMPPPPQMGYYGEPIEYYGEAPQYGYYGEAPEYGSYGEPGYGFAEADYGDYGEMEPVGYYAGTPE